MKRVVVKVGSSCLTKNNCKLDIPQLEMLVGDMAELRKHCDVVFVTSGAVAAGMGMLALPSRPRRLEQLQAMAAIGQSVLMHRYQILFSKQGITTAQILLSEEDFSVRERFLNFRNTLEELLKLKILPIINENDPVATKELRIGDNDTLSAAVASNIGADFLFMLSDVDGLYDKNPRLKGAKLIERVEKITPEIASLKGGGKASHGVGGISTKIQAVNICGQAGVTMILMNGRRKGLLLSAFRGEPAGTTFVPSVRKPKKNLWVQVAKPKGVVIVDAGAWKALKEKKSLLASGIVGVSGFFPRGEVVEIRADSGELIGKGVCSYSSDELQKAKGLRSAQILKIFGYSVPGPAIPRELMFIKP